MRVLVLEGIATSGKSTVISRLQKRLEGRRIRVVDEAETHVPIMSHTKDLHVEFFGDLIERVATDEPDLIIFDRLYLTQAFRAGVSLEQYARIEARFAELGTLTVFLKVAEDSIADRVAKAAQHRDPSWGEYIKTKGGNIDEIADYYSTQQQDQMRLLATSSLPYVICDTTAHNYDEVVGTIISELHLR